MKTIGLLFLLAAAGLAYWGMNILAGAYCSENSGRVLLYGILFGIGIFIIVLFGVGIFSEFTGLDSVPGCLAVIVLAAAGIGGMFYFSNQRARLACPAGDITSALSSACRGQGNPAAGVFDPRQAGGAHVLMMSTTGGAHKNSRLAPPAWKPDSLADTELVLCISEPKETLIETCQYVGGRDIERYRTTMFAALVSASTGQGLASKNFTCQPRDCSLHEMQNTAKLDCSLDVKQAIQWAEEMIANPPAAWSDASSSAQKPPSPTEQAPTLAPTTTARPTTAPAATALPFAVVKASSARVRIAPDTGSATLAGLRKDDRVKVHGCNLARDWVKVELPDRQQGWVFAELLSLPVPITSLPIVK